MNLSSIAVHKASPAKPPANARLVQAAHQFEALLLESLITAMEKGFALPGEASPLGTQGYGQLGAQALASGLSAAGGIGISTFVIHKLMKTNPISRAPEAEKS